ncbi:hypothetical protein ACFLXE_05185 [Chloroflexota bacterium]
MEDEQRIRYAIERTEVVRYPEQTLATFGLTNVYYYLLTEPVYSELLSEEDEAVVREGKVIVERPKIVTPYYLLNLFEGFEHGTEYAHYMLREFGPNEPGLLYRYKNEMLEMNVLSSPLESVIHNLSEKIDREKNRMAAIIKGIDEFWDVSLMKFIHDLTRNSVRTNVMEMGARRLLDMDVTGVTRYTRHSIEQLFAEAKEEKAKAYELEDELRRWGLFEEYEDRFLDLFRR